MNCGGRRDASRVGVVVQVKALLKYLSRFVRRKVGKVSTVWTVRD